MIKIDIKIATDPTVEIGKCHIEVELSMHEIIEEGHRYDQKYRSDFRKGNFRRTQKL